MRTLPDLTRRREELQEASAFIEYTRMLARRGQVDDLPDTPPLRKIKAAVAMADHAALRNAATEFVRLVDQGTVIGQMAAGWLPAPPFVPVVAPDVDPTGTFVGGGAPIPATTLPITSLTTEIAKLATIFPFDQRTLASPDPRARRLFETSFVNWLRVLEDREFLSATAAIPGTRPAGILSAAPELGGGSPSSLATDLAALYAYVSGGHPLAPYFIASSRAALHLTLLEGGAEFPDAKITGGSIGGVPLITADAAANKIILVDAARLVVVDELLDVAASTLAAIQMDDAPTNSAVTGLGAALVSGWQTNSVFVRAVRYLWWALTTADAVAFTEIAGLPTTPARAA